MTKIKIISNPYEKYITYQRWDDDAQEWADIDNGLYNGNLMREKLIYGFFPFIVKEAVSDIVEEYEDYSAKIQLFFEGTSDEYQELKKLCVTDAYSKYIELQPQEVYLNNAREVLPQIRQIFQKIKPLVEKSVTEESEYKEDVEINLAKFTDASNEVIPICVIGNYSAGKSTFINALIGNEILPSGDKAVTARVFKIRQKADSENARIRFDYAGSHVDIKIESDSLNVTGLPEQNQLSVLMNGVAVDPDCNSVNLKVGKILSIINNYNNNGDEEKLGRIIEIEIPFNRGLWKESAGKFVILDTPGSNAASHSDHKEVLVEAMKGLSNGIPIYVAGYENLDSTDNEELYDVVKGIEGLDSRFTMIISNKADGANLPRKGFSETEKQELLSQAIPKNLYSGGLYFVSSVIGLGSKVDGCFVDEHCQELFEDQKEKYQNENNRRYKQLFLYNILPEQLVPSAIEDAVSCQDKLFVNSGLYSVERDIKIFASKYSSYNKCHQSQMFLGRVLIQTQRELEAATEKRKVSRMEMEEKLERDTQEMLTNVDYEAASELNKYQENYNDNLIDVIEASKAYFSADELREEEDRLTEQHKESMDFDFIKSDVQKQVNDIGDALKKGFSMFGEKPSFKALKNIGSSFMKESREAIDSSKTYLESSRKIDRAAADDLISEINGKFLEQAEKAEQDLDSASRNYWMDCTVRFKDKLAEVVRATSLSDDKKAELQILIGSYKRLVFDERECEVFDKDEFNYLLEFGDVKLFRMDKLFLDRLSSAYKDRISKLVDRVNLTIQDVYQDSFSNWKENLVNAVRSNIVDYSPELKAQQKKIEEETAVIQELQVRQNKLKNFANEIDGMVAWRTF